MTFHLPQSQANLTFTILYMMMMNWMEWEIPSSLVLEILLVLHLVTGDRLTNRYIKYSLYSLHFHWQLVLVTYIVINEGNLLQFTMLCEIPLVQWFLPFFEIIREQHFWTFTLSTQASTTNTVSFKMVEISPIFIKQFVKVCCQQLTLLSIWLECWISWIHFRLFTHLY